MHAVKEYFVVQRHIGELKLYKSFSLNFAMRIIVFFLAKISSERIIITIISKAATTALNNAMIFDWCCVYSEHAMQFFSSFVQPIDFFHLCEHAKGATSFRFFFCVLVELA